TLILAFARRQILSRELLGRMFPLTLPPLVMAFALQATQPISLLILLHLTVFFVASMLCHAALAADRPETKHLTKFYLWLSAGGVLGGVFNALLAPLVFNSIAEYQLTLILASWLGLRISASDKPAPESRNDLLWPAVLGLSTAAFVLALE